VGNLIFLVGAVVLSVVGSVWLWLRNRPPTSVMSSIDGFREEMSALAGERPPASSDPAPPRRSPRPHRGRPAAERPGAGRPPARPSTQQPPAQQPLAQQPPAQQPRARADGDVERER
jgi:hypothetical protein